jgi:hypothetical protein
MQVPNVLVLPLIDRHSSNYAILIQLNKLETQVIGEDAFLKPRV